MNPAKTLIIINPASGTNSKKEFTKLFNKYLDHNQYDFSIEFTSQPGHATRLAQSAVLNAYGNIIAVGGDGTINEIARALIHTETALGIIPAGSGNGLARHLGIPLNPIKAINSLNNVSINSIDSASINGKPFFCTAGVGFDAHIGHKFSKAESRGLKSYIKISLKEFFRYSSHTYTIQTEDNRIKQEAFLVTFANTNQYGNNAFIAPKANIRDGLLDLCILKPFPLYLAPLIGVRLFASRIHQSRYMSTSKFTELLFERDKEGPVHLDGEPFTMPARLLVKCVPGSLNVLIPLED